jgi:hypothetical protein
MFLDYRQLKCEKVRSWFGTDISVYLKNGNQLDAAYFIVLLIDSTCFGHYYAHHQELTTMMFTKLVVWFCEGGRGSVNVKLWFFKCCMCGVEILCRLVVAD